MNAITRQPGPRPVDSAIRSDDAVRLVLLRTVADLTIALLYLSLSLQSGAWQLIAMTAVMLSLVVLALTGMFLIRRGREVLGVWLVIGGLLPVLFINSLLIAGLGLILAVAALLMTSLGATQALPPKHVNWAIIAGAAASVLTLLVDVLNPPLDRLQVPEPVQIFFPIVVGLLILILAIFILRRFRDYTLRTKLIVSYLAVALIPLGLLAFLDNLTTQNRLTEDANQRLAASAAQSAASIDAFFRTNLDSVRAEAGLPGFAAALNSGSQAPAWVAQRPVLVNLSNKDPEHIVSYGLLNKQGFNIADSVKENIGLSEADHDYFRVVVQTNQPYVSPVFFSNETGDAQIFFSSPVRNVVGEVVGVLRVIFKADILQKLIEESTTDENSFAVLFDENHLHLAHSDEQTAREVNYKLVVQPQDPGRLTRLLAANRLPKLPIPELSTDLPDLEYNLTNWAVQPFFEAADVATGDKLNQVAVTSLAMRPWLLAFFQPQEILFEPVENQTRNIVFFAMGIGLVAALVAVEISQRLANPIVRLTAAAQKVTEGDLMVQAPVESQDEIGQLSAVFNSMTTQLNQVVGSLEHQVRERTAELALSMEVGQRASTIRDLAELLPTITEFIRKRFDLYYVQVYFVNDIGRDLVIKSGTGEVGNQLMARGHSLPIGNTSIVGRVAASGRTVMVSDTDGSDIHLPNPMLPKTRSELAVPLTIEGGVIGVLDMQATRVNAFTVSNQTVFEAMATQLAISIDSAQQWTAAQDAQRKTEAALRQLTQKTWRDTLTTRPEGLAFTYDLVAVAPDEAGSTNSSEQEHAGDLTVPVLVQNEPIGQLSVEIPPGQRWSKDEHAFLEAVAQQIAQKAENLRLFEDTQQRATREQIARQITNKIRASQNMETALRTAAEELSKALGVARAEVDLQANDEVDTADQAEK
jgi:GAF domain-containing protein